VTTFVGLLVTTLISDGLQINGANDLVAGPPSSSGWPPCSRT
jgi:hypothetical protein